ncbi:hypothetical protein J5N97_016045 [Dioscorea zingiberensis]|uniref:protein-serine/threonine phosphatase n=1 Tax=Dioscorea zingiberensis TaxID=325984 RepID=A0A9D5CL53_9LILI|nr:hypothetical protein J5N97_016045 [Dioscorea zingiberensis]
MSTQLLFLLLSFLVLISAQPSFNAESEMCLDVYKEGGATAVFLSPECPRWNLLPDDRRPSSPGCDLAIQQGRRKSQEDRAVCSLGMGVPILGKEINVSLVAVFDGHNGHEASDMASRLLLQYFSLHVSFILDLISFFFAKLPEAYALFNPIVDVMPVIPVLFFLLAFVWQAAEALARGLESGSTAIIILIADGQILAVNVGDSKAILCSEDLHPHASKGYASRLRPRTRRGGYLAKELTEDHHPSRDDEKHRVEAAGGYVQEWAGVFRVNGQLAVTRAIGDMHFKRYGVISRPEVTWHAITNNDRFLVVSSDGILEKMTTQDVCDLLWDRETSADFIVNSAFERGSMDNMAAIVIPLRAYENSANDVPCTSLVPMEYTDQIMLKFKQMLVEAKYKGAGCFYLFEKLNEIMDFVFEDPNGYLKVEADDLLTSLPESLKAARSRVRLADLYDDHKFCPFIDTDYEANKGQCAIPEVFPQLLGLLDSVPYNETTSESIQHESPNIRYVLKRNYDRGGFGDVWLAFHRDCSHDDPSDGHAFILKRIMVERRTDAYLSGLREKYFGEVFMNAIAASGDFMDGFHANYGIPRVNEKGLNQIARFVESFESNSKEIWLVFRKEGVSLNKLIYTTDEINQAASKSLSAWWHWLKTTDAGAKELQDIIWQLLMALKACHDRYITHRDIKPVHANMIESSIVQNLRIIDFGSAIDDFTLKYMYGSGPTRYEQTYEYSPPEALLNASWFRGPKDVTLKFATIFLL